jgi:hypothetical protein
MKRSIYRSFPKVINRVFEYLIQVTHFEPFPVDFKTPPDISVVMTLCRRHPIAEHFYDIEQVRTVYPKWYSDP